ncbi:segregation/condensation protein A [Candidatus Uhrbacteria bacterium]|nr:segregation/condensation protein A [Candidatus Uhrbacteria bacterium]
MAYLVKLEHFEGPLDLLLQLIEREELSITEISLAKITDDYLTIIRTAKEIEPEELADFLVVAAKLILIKSQILLPGIEMEADEGPSLEAQLKLYREFLEASKRVEAMLAEKRVMFGRKKPLIERVPEFLPPSRLAAETLARAFQAVLKSLEPLFRLPKIAIERAISIQEKIARIRTLILDRVAVKFGEIMKEAKSKTEVIVSFLALLELVKQRAIEAKQDSLFHEITLHKHHEIPSA